MTRHKMIIHRCNSEHSLKCDSESSPEVIIIGFESDSALLDGFSREPVTLSDGMIKKLAEIIKEGRNVFLPPFNIPVYDMKKRKKQPFGSEQLLKMLLEYFLVTLVRNYSLSESAEETREIAPDIEEIIGYVSGNCLEKITIDELAFLFRTNRSTLCKEFKAATGKTLVEFINEKKFEIACKKISETNDNFTKISENMKFESIHYFTRFFKKMSGMSPSAFRKKQRE
ncbi:MAG: helix-turn-helix transcriptional regulator [Clostridia bacterium]|nr:helix-turn-helix transcriptional regulator [Clostridia bacterium]